ncbi:MAG: diguanylate cyclase [Eubacterium sp.]|nr:diguanylate cyclase [Eubacterium sp.]
MNKEQYQVVIVDDDPVCLRMAKRMLSKGGIRVSCVRSGHDLLTLIEKYTPDLILLDILMPEMDGFDTYRALQEYEESAGRTSTPVIFLTGESDVEMERRGLKTGASDFIRKPFDKDILLKRIINTIENNRMIESLTEEATVDRLTGFLNKISGTDTISKCCMDHRGALMIFDLDSFKLVNDLFGHDMGDRVLVAFSNIVRNNIREEDVVSRIGGDEFLAFFRDVSDEKSVSALCERLNEQLEKEAEKLMGAEHGIPLGISIGVAFAPEHGRSYKILFSYADNSLYRVKQAGKHGYEIYSMESDPESGEEDLETELLRTSQIVEERGDSKGAMLLGQDAFSWNYRYVVRFMERYDGVANRLLFSLSIRAKGPMFSEVAAEFAAVLQRTLRKSDIIWQSKPNKFFVLLPQLSERDTPGVIRRITRAWERTGYHQRAEISYRSSPIVVEK